MSIIVKLRNINKLPCIGHIKSGDVSCVAHFPPGFRVFGAKITPDCYLCWTLATDTFSEFWANLRHRRGVAEGSTLSAACLLVCRHESGSNYINYREVCWWKCLQLKICPRNENAPSSQSQPLVTRMSHIALDRA